MRRICIILLFFILFYVSCDNEMYKEKLVAPVKQVNDTIIAKVNGIPITLSEYKREVKSLPPQLKNLLKDKEKKKQFVENIITKELLYQEARKENIDKMKIIQDMVRNYKRNLMINELINIKIKNEVNISDEEAYKYYIENKKDFYLPDKVEYTKYFFKDYTDAVNFLKDFDITQCYNKCYSEKVSLKSITDIPQNIGFELEKLKAGDYSKNILFTNSGYLIVKLNKRIKGTLEPFYKVKNLIKSKLKEAKEKKYLDEYISLIKTQATIQIFWEKIK